MNRPVRFSEMTPEEIKIISNGCGARKWFKPPWRDYFTASCDQHDFYYTRGGRIEDKIRADIAFVAHMLLDCSKLTTTTRKHRIFKLEFKVEWPGWFRMMAHAALGITYFWLVSFFGCFGPFHFGPYRTKQQMLEASV